MATVMRRWLWRYDLLSEWNPTGNPLQQTAMDKERKKKDHEHRDEEIMCQSQAVTNAKSIIYIQTLFTPDITQG